MAYRNSFWSRACSTGHAMEAGFHNVTCSLGTHLNARQFQQLCDGPREPSISPLIRTGNGSGQQAARCLSRSLRERGVTARPGLTSRGPRPPTASSSTVATLMSFTASWRGLAREIPSSSTAGTEQRPEPVSRDGRRRSRSALGQPLPGSAESPQRCGNYLAQLCVRSAAFSALVGECKSHHGSHGEDAHGIRLARLHSFPNQSAAAACRRQYQPQSRYRSTAHWGSPSPRTDSLRSRLSVWLLAPAPARHRATAPGLEPLTCEDTATRHRAVIGRRSGAIFGPVSAPRGIWPSSA